eukprot:SAG11_NODE_2251_length_3633_cov_15.438031_1_plen_154_part_00
MLRTKSCELRSLRSLVPANNWIPSPAHGYRHSSVAAEALETVGGLTTHPAERRLLATMAAGGQLSVQTAEVDKVISDCTVTHRPNTHTNWRRPLYTMRLLTECSIFARPSGHKATADVGGRPSLSGCNGRGEEERRGGHQCCTSILLEWVSMW